MAVLAAHNKGYAGQEYRIAAIFAIRIYVRRVCTYKLYYTRQKITTTRIYYILTSRSFVNNQQIPHLGCYMHIMHHQRACVYSHTTQADDDDLSIICAEYKVIRNSTPLSPTHHHADGMMFSLLQNRQINSRKSAGLYIGVLHNFFGYSTTAAAAAAIAANKLDNSTGTGF